MNTTQNSVPAKATPIHTYAELLEFAEKFAAGRFRFMAIVSTPGLSKTETLRRVFRHKQHLLVSGHTTAFMLYQNLFDYLDDPVVVDDADTLFDDRPTRPLLKALCNTQPVRRVAWNTKALPPSFPRQYNTRSPVCVLCNEWRTVAALDDRGHFLNFTPSVNEVHRQVGTWFQDSEVYELIEKHLRLILVPSMRYYVKALELKRAGISRWQDRTISMLNPNTDKRAIEALSRLMADDSIPTETQRLAMFKRQTGMSQGTYYHYRRMLQRASGKRL